MFVNYVMSVYSHCRGLVHQLMVRIIVLYVCNVPAFGVTCPGFWVTHEQSCIPENCHVYQNIESGEHITCKNGGCVSKYTRF
jgi:hypothetical protein